MKRPKLDARQRAARKRQLTAAIRAREAVIARWSTYVQDDYLRLGLERMRSEVGELKAERARLDQLDPGRASELAGTMLAGGRRDG